MDLISAIIGLGGGSLVGYFFGTSKAPKQVRNAEKNFKNELRQQHELVTAHKDRAADANKKLQSAKKELSAAKKDMSRAEQQIRDLKKRPFQSAKKTNAHRPATKQKANKKGAAQPSEGAVAPEQLEKIRAERDAALSSERGAKKIQQKLKTQLDDLQKQLSQLRSTAKKRTQQLETVKLELDVEELTKAFDACDKSVNGVLKTLVETQQLDSAVLADSNGIVVAKSGSLEIMDGMAASSRLISSQTKQMSDLVPFSTLQTFHFVDENQMVIAGNEFILKHGESLSLVTYGGHYPNENSVALTKQHLERILG